MDNSDPNISEKQPLLDNEQPSTTNENVEDDALPSPTPSQHSHSSHSSVRRNKKPVTPLEFILLVIVMFLSIFIIIFGILYSKSNDTSKAEEEVNVSHFIN
ncbi:hypothetical protein BCR36DRAFT_371810 [Piromyces finnis]|uniref:Uncharacterized protein n=1 Tax=Piromyces finnis TaxID=1754191 RepID=A0A1Y1V4X2_9FUNG|nr:hypothetical protein BCR36DRAFT_371810 [Piromyces finnis]|eukprot:ORX47325.1 hypothetical protein BCR36DRAFT_371810 [Piromyces finnis]